MIVEAAGTVHKLVSFQLYHAADDNLGKGGTTPDCGGVCCSVDMLIQKCEDGRPAKLYFCITILSYEW